MKKLIITLWIFTLLIFTFPFNSVLAGDTSGLEMGTLVPQTKIWTNCKELMDALDTKENPAYYFSHPEQMENGDVYRNDVLSCSIQTGRVHLWMIPYYVVYLIEFLIGIAGLLAVLFLVIGGFQYVASGLSEQKDKAKGTIKNALMGLGVALAAWTVVNLIQYIVTL